MSGALDEQTAILARLAELAEQSANGTLSSTQRLTLSREYQQLVREYGRVGDVTSFNGLNLLRGNRVNGAGNISFQAGINGGAGARLQLSAIDTGSVSGVINPKKFSNTDFDQDGDLGTDDDIEALAEAQTREVLLARLKNQALSYEITDSGGRPRDVVIGFGGDGSDFFLLTFVSDPSTGLFSATAQTVTNFAAMLADSPGSYTVDLASGRVNNATAAMVDTEAGAQILVELEGLRILVGQTRTSIDMTGIETTSRALEAIDLISSKLEELARLKGQIGAVESRLNAALALMAVSRENFSAAESRIRDADVASETARLTRLQILQQSGAAVLQQANLQPQLALQLLSP